MPPWKLGAIIHHKAGAQLLETYHAERHPVGRFAARQSLTRPAAQWLAEGTKAVDLPSAPDLPLFFLILRYRYRSQAIISEGVDSLAPDEIALLDNQTLTGLPGTPGLARAGIAAAWAARRPAAKATAAKRAMRDRLSCRVIPATEMTGACLSRHPWTRRNARAQAISTGGEGRSGRR